MTKSFDEHNTARHSTVRHNIVADKRLGQHFLFDKNLCDRIARTAGELQNTTVLEIGPGPGELTRALLANGAGRVIAIEKDKRFLPTLTDLADEYTNKLEVIAGDALCLSKNVITETASKLKIVANLPYNISLPLLLMWLELEPWPPGYQSATVMVQKEVADRIMAKPGTKQYGRISVISQWRCQTEMAFTIKPEAFTPPPKVLSAVIHLTPREKLSAYCSPLALKKLTGAAFGQRRKMLRTSLKQLTTNPEDLLKKADIDGMRRGETLSVNEFLALAQLLS